eukprot:4128512-Prymnesium_polylepis.1
MCRPCPAYALLRRFDLTRTVCGTVTDPEVRSWSCGFYRSVCMPQRSCTTVSAHSGAVTPHALRLYSPTPVARRGGRDDRGAPRASAEGGARQVGLAGGEELIQLRDARLQPFALGSLARMALWVTDVVQP